MVRLDKLGLYATGLILCIALVFWLTWRTGPQEKPVTAAYWVGSAGQHSQYMERTQAVVVEPRDSTVPTVRVPGPLPAWAGQTGIEGEFWIRVNSAEEGEQLRAYAARNGLQVLSTIAGLNAFRLAGRPVDWQGLPLDEWEGGANVTIYIPDFPGPENHGVSTLPGVGARLAEAVGVDSLNRDWGQGILVAVLDTGIPPDSVAGLRISGHIDMVGKDADEWLPHGAAVAHLLAGDADLSSGLARGVDILDIRVLGANGSGDAFTLAAGIVAAVDAGAQVINASLGGYQNSAILAAAVQYAAQHGVIMVAAAGNDGSGRPLFPAAYPEVIAVAAHDAARQNAPFSNHGNHIDLSAPGVGLYTLWTDQQWVVFDGTSAAAPLVAAAAATLLSAEPHLSSLQVREILQEFSADAGRPGRDPFFGSGTLDLGRVLNRNQPGWFDVAVADMTIAGGQERPALQLSVQNLGTELVVGSTVNVSINDQSFMPLTLNALRPGETVLIEVPVDLIRSDLLNDLEIDAEVRLPGHLNDQRPANNRTRFTVRPVP
ncbi:MAG: S8 family serine peptidase [Verrucomicrobia bacterium]|nr:S8 family serine peptidase [Verrucomicrobiota bacterium]